MAFSVISIFPTLSFAVYAVITTSFAIEVTSIFADADGFLSSEFSSFIAR